MAKRVAEDVTELVRRAQSIGPEREHRYVYGDSSASNTPRFVMRPNKKAVDRKVSTFSIIVLLFGLGFAIVSYIGNIIAVNTLATEVNQMQARYDKIMNGNAILKAEINRKTAWERIGKIAAEQVGLRYPQQQPMLFDIDEEKMEQVRKSLQTR